jgi:hypothetical protein
VSVGFMRFVGFSACQLSLTTISKSHRLNMMSPPDPAEDHDPILEARLSKVSNL